MISRPTTERLLEEVARELEGPVLGAVTDPGARVAVEQLVQIVRSCGRRAGGEIAWMREESEALVEFAADVADRFGDQATAEALAAYAQADGEDLRLVSVAAAYSLASDAFSRAADAAFAAGATELTDTARALMQQRTDRETEIRGEFTMPGRG